VKGLGRDQPDRQASPATPCQPQDDRFPINPRSEATWPLPDPRCHRHPDEPGSRHSPFEQVVHGHYYLVHGTTGRRRWTRPDRSGPRRGHATAPRAEAVSAGRSSGRPASADRPGGPEEPDGAAGAAASRSMGPRGGECRTRPRRNRPHPRLGTAETPRRADRRGSHPQSGMRPPSGARRRRSRQGTPSHGGRASPHYPASRAVSAHENRCRSAGANSAGAWRSVRDRKLPLDFQ
jgi:hypothetical protein